MQQADNELLRSKRRPSRTPESAVRHKNNNEIAGRRETAATVWTGGGAMRVENDGGGLLLADVRRGSPQRARYCIAGRETPEKNKVPRIYFMRTAVVTFLSKKCKKKIHLYSVVAQK